MASAEIKRRQEKRAGSRGAKGRSLVRLALTALAVIMVAAFYAVLHDGGLYRATGRSGATGRIGQNTTLRLYFADAGGERLTVEPRAVRWLPSLDGRIEQAVQELLKGPRGSLGRTIPPSVALKGVCVGGDGVAWIDFSAALQSAHPGGSTAELMTIYSIVNTVSQNCAEVRKVGIMVDGKRIDSLAGHIDCREPFAANAIVGE